MLFPTRRSLSIVACTALAASEAQAQSSASGLISGVSTQCQNAVVSLLSSPFGTCAALTQLVSVVTTSGSVVTPINTWLGSACSRDCNASTLSTARSTVESGCSAEISSGNVLALLLQTAVSNYTQLRTAACYESTSNSTLCLTQLLTDVQSATGGDLTLDNALTIPSNTSALSAIPAAEICSDCNKALYSTLFPLLTSASSSDASSFSSIASQKCGSSFIDGSIPSTVSTSSGNSSSGSTGATGTGSGSTSSTPLSAAKGLRLTLNEVLVAGTGIIVGAVALL